MSTKVSRCFLPSFWTNGCRRLSSSTRPTCIGRKRPQIDRTADNILIDSDHTSPKLLSRRSVHQHSSTPSDGENLVGDQQTLEELLYPGTKEVATSLIPLSAAADVVMKLRSIPEGIPTPPEIVVKVCNIIERGKEWREALYRLAMSLKRPGETPDSGKNGELIGRLLHITISDPAQTPYEVSSLALIGTLRSRETREPTVLLTDYSVHARQEYARRESAGLIPPFLVTSRMMYQIRQESDPSKKEALVQECIQALETLAGQGNEKLSARQRACMRLGALYASGHLCPRDGQKAKLWWSRNVSLGRGVLGYSPESAYDLGLVYLAKQSAGCGEVPLFAPDFSKGFRYLHLAKWTFPPAAHVLGQLYYLDPQNDQCTTVAEHISLHGVIPDDVLAAEAFCIGAERHKYAVSRYKFAEMLYMGRAHPPVDPRTVAKDAYVRRPIPGDHDWSVEGLETALSLYDFDDEPVIEFAPRSRLDTLEYAWRLVEPYVTGKDPKLTIPPDDPLASLPDLIKLEREGKEGHR